MLTASTRGIDTKPVPVIVIIVDVLSIVAGLIEVNVGAGSPTSILPEAPKATVTELYVTASLTKVEFARGNSLLLLMLPANLSLVTIHGTIMVFFVLTAGLLPMYAIFILNY